ncbi:MAG TPA: hypothetical protein PK926_07630 [Spirochaetota bacterium]|nr:hypothetical protein [Spirochaetota bacterium]HPI90189.1 hypothetical protein [Spirochaetota bacterium]HPR46340.1 hypothetical protein [Spirochaetota bacterium]
MKFNKRKPSIGRIIFWVIMGIVAAVFFSAVFAVAVTFLWNWLMPGLFGLPEVGYLQALGLVLLARLLVGGWHKGHRDNHGDHFHRIFKRKDVPGSDEIHEPGDDFREFWEAEGRESYRKYLESR